MAEGYVHTTFADGRWTNSIEGGDGAPLGSYETKDAATRAGRGEARRRHTEHVIHNQDGTIAERNSYGDDPGDRPG